MGHGPMEPEGDVAARAPLGARLDGAGRCRAGSQRAFPPHLHHADHHRRARRPEAAMKLGVKDLFGLLKRSVSGWSNDNASSMGAALAFYTLLSMAPLLVLVITLAGLFIGRDEAQDILMGQMSGLLGDTGAQGVQVLLEAAQNPEGGLIATVVSLATLAVGATTVFAELKSDLD